MLREQQWLCIPRPIKKKHTKYVTEIKYQRSHRQECLMYREKLQPYLQLSLAHHNLLKCLLKKWPGESDLPRHQIWRGESTEYLKEKLKKSICNSVN